VPEADLGKAVPVVVLAAVATRAVQHPATSVHPAIRAAPLAIIPKADEMAAPAVSKVPAEAAGPVAAKAVRPQSL